MALSPKQARFVAEYLIDLNATQAAIRAGYTTNENAAAVTGSRLLRNGCVRELINARLMQGELRPPGSVRQPRPGATPQNIDNRRRGWARWAMRKYKIDAETWARTYHAQGGRCFTCDSRFEDSGDAIPCIDHCHDTGAARGLICGPCNRTLGAARDNPVTLRRLAEYLETAPHWARSAA